LKDSLTRRLETQAGILKLDGGTLRSGLRAAAAAAIAASASCFAARRAALLFVLGVMFGAAMLLGRGLGLVGAVVAVFSDDLEVTVEGLGTLAVEGRIAATEAARLTLH